MLKNFPWIGLFGVENCVSEFTVGFFSLFDRQILLVDRVIFYSGQCARLLLLRHLLLHLEPLKQFHGALYGLGLRLTVLLSAVLLDEARLLRDLGFLLA